MESSSSSARALKRMIAVVLALLGYLILINQAFAAEAVPAAKKQTAAEKPKVAVKAVTADPKMVVKKNESASSEDDSKKLRKVVEGKVVHVTKRAISVEYEMKAQESNEMLLPLSADLTLEGGIKELSQLKFGDQVKVGIEQTYKDNPDGTKTILKTEALVVALIQRASDASVAAPVGAAAAQ